MRRHSCQRACARREVVGMDRAAVLVRVVAGEIEQLAVEVVEIALAVGRPGDRRDRDPPARAGAVRAGRSRAPPPAPRAAPAAGASPPGASTSMPCALQGGQAVGRAVHVDHAQRAERACLPSKPAAARRRSGFAAGRRPADCRRSARRASRRALPSPASCSMACEQNEMLLRFSVCAVPWRARKRCFPPTSRLTSADRRRRTGCRRNGRWRRARDRLSSVSRPYVSTTQVRCSSVAGSSDGNGPATGRKVGA